MSYDPIPSIRYKNDDTKDEYGIEITNTETFINSANARDPVQYENSLEEKTVIGWKATLKDGFKGDAIFVKTDITAHDGIIHVINKVLA